MSIQIVKGLGLVIVLSKTCKEQISDIATND